MHKDEIDCLRTIEWKDLLSLNRLEILNELSISLPWLVGSWVAASYEQYLIALICSFMFFLTGLRQVHNAYHYALGISRRLTEWVMFGLSILMLGSMHAIQINHLRHHRYCMEEEDIEAMSARLPGWQAVLIGPFFPLRLHLKAIEVGSRRQRSWILAELVANVAWVGLVFGVLEVKWLEYHVLAMAAGQCLTAFFAVWTVHHDCEAEKLKARTIRGRFKALLTYNMFFHVEHHLFPAVPTCKLDILARRLDRMAPDLVAKKVF
ncbi:fatty acid desaturase [Alcanivorax xiamenensis]|uniref:Fatty acid desaturase n=1 Tax=Alcanivorax xiamenensis TaxID=1177156 RepID=A0ABQ6Y8F0_9GAMM|nr:fatty acid desaturase [Alcanivorax xiamenensis]KAF0805877.1 fatty acid desaturase [Alcanivorax xiamenensis]